MPERGTSSKQRTADDLDEIEQKVVFDDELPIAGNLAIVPEYGRHKTSASRRSWLAPLQRAPAGLDVVPAGGAGREVVELLVGVGPGGGRASRLARAIPRLWRAGVERHADEGDIGSEGPKVGDRGHAVEGADAVREQCLGARWELWLRFAARHRSILARDIRSGQRYEFRRAPRAGPPPDRPFAPPRRRRGRARR